jgi:hypothetical protein
MKTKIELNPNITLVVGPSHLINTTEEWKEHREKLNGAIQTALDLTESTDGYKKMIVFGAGRCDDFDLEKFATQPEVTQIDIVDLDSQNATEAINQVRQRTTNKVANMRIIEMDASLILTQLFQELDQYFNNLQDGTLRIVGEEDVDYNLQQIFQIIAKSCSTATHPPELHEQYDLAVSDCIVSQFLVSIESYLETQLIRKIRRNQYINNLQAIWSRIKYYIPRIIVPHHLNTIQKTIRPGGTLFFATDHTELKQQSRTTRIILGPNDDLETITKSTFPECNITAINHWVWNRIPNQAQELVTGITVVTKPKVKY